MECKVCESEFDENINLNQCPICGEKYLSISLTDYQRLIERIQNEQYKMEKIYNQVVKESLSSNKFKNHLSRERDIYGSINAFFNVLMEDFNIPKTEDRWSEPHYDAPRPCQMNPHKVCNSCGDC